jgi:hypothetical protein
VTTLEVALVRTLHDDVFDEYAGDRLRARETNLKAHVATGAFGRTVMSVGAPVPRSA